MRNANGIVQIKNFTMQFNVDKMLVVEVKGKKVILHTKNDHEARAMYQSGYTDWIAAHNKDKISDACHSHQGKTGASAGAELLWQVCYEIAREERNYIVLFYSI